MPVKSVLLSAALLWPVLAPNTFAQAKSGALTEADRAALLQQLDEIKGQANDSALARFTNAGTAFRAAVASDKAVIELYVRCVEQVEFTERKRSAAEFRDWKKDNRTQLGDPQFARALRFQLRWLTLTLQANAKPEELAVLAPEAASLIDAIFSEPKELGPRARLLVENVNESVFAKAYKLTRDQAGKWPPAPLARTETGYTAAPVYDLVIMPPLREKHDYPGLREAWNKRIKQDEIAAGFWSGEAKATESGNSSQRTKFLTEILPGLQWQREVFLFESGDEKQSALNLIKMLTEHLSDPHAREWEKEFRDLVSPVPSAHAGPASPPGRGAGRGIARSR